MSKYYATCKGDTAKNETNRRGHHTITAVVRSYKGSVGLTMSDNPNGSDDPLLEMNYEADKSTANPYGVVFMTTLSKFLEMAEAIDPVWSDLEMED